MTAQILQLRDYQSKRAIERAHKELEAHAIEIANMAFPHVLEHYHDTAPCEILHTDNDPA